MKRYSMQFFFMNKFFYQIKFEFLHLKKLKHPNIIKVKQLLIDIHFGKVYTIMEFADAPEMFITI